MTGLCGWFTTDGVIPPGGIEARANTLHIPSGASSGHQELIRDGETGWLFPAGDAAALARVVVDTLARQDDWQRVRAAGRRYVETERNWRVSVARYRQVYGSVLPNLEIASAG